jgi:hypothetical protein
MSPGDVCQFEIVRGDDGQAYLKSTDDSLLANAPTTAADFQPIFASQCATQAGDYCKDGALYVKAYDDQLPTNTGGVLTSTVTANPPLIAAHAHNSNADDNELGHIEVIGAWGAQGSIKFNDVSDAEVIQSGGKLQNRILVKRGMSKADLYKIMGVLVPSTANGQGQLQTRQRLASYDQPLQNEAAAYATGRLVGGVCQVDPISATDALQGSTIVSAANYGEPCDVNTGLAIPYAAPSTAAQVGSKIRSTDPRWIRLTGLVEMENTATGDRMGMQMTALEGDIWDNLTPRDSVTPYGLRSNDPTGVFDAALNPFAYAFDGRVISTPTFDVDPSRTLSVGDGFAQSRAGLGAVPTYDNIVEVENALAASNMAFTYENDGKNSTNLIVTFPTKYRHLSNQGYQALGACKNDRSDYNANGDRICIDRTVFNDGGDVCGNGYTGRYYYPPFRSEQSGSIVRSLSSYDNQENVIGGVAAFDPFSGRFAVAGAPTTITDEVNYMFIPTWPFAGGWANLGLTAEPGCAYAGVPVLAYAHKTQVTAAGFTNSWLVPLTKNAAND